MQCGGQPQSRHVHDSDPSSSTACLIRRTRIPTPFEAATQSSEAPSSSMQGAGLASSRVEGFGFSDEGLELRGSGLGFRVQGLGSRT